MPRQKETGEMDLSDKKVRVSPLIYAMSGGVRSDNLIKNTHQWIQVHVHVNEVWWRMISEGSPEEKKRIPSKYELLGLTGGIFVTAMSNVGVKAGLWGTVLRHCNGISNHATSGH